MKVADQPRAVKPTAEKPLYIIVRQYKDPSRMREDGPSRQGDDWYPSGGVITKRMNDAELAEFAKNEAADYRSSDPTFGGLIALKKAPRRLWIRKVEVLSDVKVNL